jgi:hypothetical protein
MSVITPLVQKLLGGHMSYKTYCFLHLNLINFYAEQFIGKVLVELKLVQVLYITTSWGLLQHPRFTAS